MIWNAFVIAFRQIRRNFLRSILTMLGIIIGVASVVSMVNFGKATTLNITKSISSLGSNLLIIKPSKSLDSRGVSVGKKLFSLREVNLLRSRIEGQISSLSPASIANAIAQYEGRNLLTNIYGVGDEYFKTTNSQIASGREFDSEEQEVVSKVCVIGDTIRATLYKEKNPLGSQLRIGNFVCEVVGVLKPKGQGAMGQDQDDLILVPIKTFNSQINSNASLNNIKYVYVSLKDGVDSTQAVKDISKILRDIRDVKEGSKDPFSIMDTKEILKTISSTTQMMTIFITAIAGISLLVGGIGIMNIMLVSVTERTKEIGIRIAIGATGAEVLLQFLVEAVVLSFLGGFLGVLFAVGVSVGLIKFFDMPFVFDLQIVLYALAFSVFIGILFGYLPARRASKLNPIEALRHE
ncbi:ABC transporter permease [uncultured Helicobacter sp.]|uniref:ABC transporter permease n=1 Tax=uncultured Helicobacter sp. TaxID=175537 RepID=UPI002639A65C|nr:ABC transporter permease [uncultured Helicobacter sp.]